MVNGSMSMSMEMIIVKYRSRVRAISERLCPADAEDLTQEVLMRAWKHRDRFRHGENPMPWLRMIVRNTNSSRRRSDSNRRSMLASMEDDPSTWHEQRAAVSSATMEASNCLSSYERASALSDLKRRIGTALDLVPPEQAAVVRLVDLGGASYREAAQAQACPVGTVMSRLHRGRRAATKKLTLPQ